MIFVVLTVALVQYLHREIFKIFPEGIATLGQLNQGF